MSAQIKDWQRGRDMPARRAQQREYCRKNRERRAASRRKYGREHRAELAHAFALFRARSFGAIGSHSLHDWERLRARYGNKCAYCGIRPGAERDHVIPLARGGTHFIGNILPVCRGCNSSKKNKLLAEWKT